jgi:hypothetical protein
MQQRTTWDQKEQKEITYKKSKNLGMGLYFAINHRGTRSKLSSLRLLKAKPLKVTRTQDLCSSVGVGPRSEEHRSKL